MAAQRAAPLEGVTASPGRRVAASLRVRPARVEDMPAVASIVTWAIEHTYAHFSEAPWTPQEAQEDFEARGDHAWLVGEWDESVVGVVVGVAFAHEWKDRSAYRHAAEIGVYVHPEHHGEGVGKALYAKLIPALAERGFRTLIAGIALPNEASVRLHESIGMHHVGTFTRVGLKHGEWRDVGYWQMHL